MGSGAGAATEAIDALVARGERVGLVQVRLYRPFPVERVHRGPPADGTNRRVLDRTKEPGAPGDPLYLDVSPRSQRREPGTLAAARHRRPVRTRLEGVHARDGQGRARPLHRRPRTASPSASSTTSRTRACRPTTTSAPTARGAARHVLRPRRRRHGRRQQAHRQDRRLAHFAQVQAYFVYDSKKSGSMTVSHVRFDDAPIRSTYLIQHANFIACHQFGLLDRIDVLGAAEPGAAFLLNSPYPADATWDRLPREVQEQIIALDLEVHVIDAHRVAREAGLAGQINTVMQACFFALIGVMPVDDALAAMRESVVAAYGRRGETIVDANIAAIDNALAALHPTSVPAAVDRDRRSSPRGHRRRARLRAARHRAHARGRGRPAPGERLPRRRRVPDGHCPRTRSAGSRTRSRCGTPRSASTAPAARSCARTPPSASSSATPTRSTASTFRRSRSAQGTSRPAPDDPGRARRLHGLRRLRRRVPGQVEVRGEAQGARHGGPGADRRPRARALGDLPRRDTCPARHPRPRDDEGFADSRTAVRVLGRVRGMRRDAVSQVADAAVRRSPDRRERHGLFVDLRRQPPDDAVVDRRRTAAAPPGRTLSSRTTPSSGSAFASRSTVRSTKRADGCLPLAPSLAGRSSRPRSSRSIRRCPSTTPRSPRNEHGSPSSSCLARLVDATTRDRAAAHRSPRSRARSCARACGSSAVTAGPTTSAPVASITCSARAAT